MRQSMERALLRHELGVQMQPAPQSLLWAERCARWKDGYKGFDMHLTYPQREDTGCREGK